MVGLQAAGVELRVVAARWVAVVGERVVPGSSEGLEGERESAVAERWRRRRW